MQPETVGFKRRTRSCIKIGGRRSEGKKPFSWPERKREALEMTVKSTAEFSIMPLQYYTSCPEIVSGVLDT